MMHQIVTKDFKNHAQCLYFGLHKQYFVWPLWLIESSYNIIVCYPGQSIYDIPSSRQDKGHCRQKNQLHYLWDTYATVTAVCVCVCVRSPTTRLIHWRQAKKKKNNYYYYYSVFFFTRQFWPCDSVKNYRFTLKITMKYQYYRVKQEKSIYVFYSSFNPQF